MIFVLAHLSTSKEEWAEQASLLYEKKISHFVKFERVLLKSSKGSRGNEAEKIREEEKVILEFLKPTDELILLDERGKAFSSEQFANLIQQKQESAKKRVVFLIGGAYGVSDEVRKRAQTQIVLAPFVLNHLVAQVVLLEQIYRAFTINKGLPYHNA